MPKKQITKAERARQQKDAAAKARTLKKYGLANFRGSLSAKAMTPARIKRVEKAFNEAQSKAVYARGHTQRMFYRPDPHKDYQLNSDYFRFIKSKAPAPNQQNIVKTGKGNIVATTDRNARIIGVSKNGTIHEKRNGQDIFTGRMTDRQTLDFIRAVDNGTYKFPNEYRIGITYFQNHSGEVTVSNLRELQRELRYYAPKLVETINQQYPNFEPLKLTFYKLSEREIAHNVKLEQRRNARAKNKAAEKKKKGKKKNRRFRSRN